MTTDTWARAVSALDAMERSDPGYAREVRAHEIRVAGIAVSFATAMGCTAAMARTVWWAGRLHDVGKLAIDRHLLFKPGRLELDERGVIAKHADLGSVVLARFGFEVPPDIAEVVCWHHESWDGSGCHGVRGEKIPRLVRLVTIADVFDALCASRVYKTGMSAEAALQIMKNEAGRVFDPSLLQAFFAVSFDVQAPSLAAPLAA